MLRIFSKKAFKFTLGEKSCKVQPLTFNDVEDWVEESDLFKLALKEKSVEIIKNSGQQKQLENDKMTKNEEEIRQKAKELGIKNFSRMGLSKLEEEIKKKEIENTEPSLGNEEDSLLAENDLNKVE